METWGKTKAFPFFFSVSPVFLLLLFTSIFVFPSQYDLLKKGQYEYDLWSHLVVESTVSVFWRRQNIFSIQLLFFLKIKISSFQPFRVPINCRNIATLFYPSCFFFFFGGCTVSSEKANRSVSSVIPGHWILTPKDC